MRLRKKYEELEKRVKELEEKGRLLEKRVSDFEEALSKKQVSQRALPKRPGLGVDVNKELVLEENKNPHNWKNPVWHHADGSVAEW